MAEVRMEGGVEERGKIRRYVPNSDAEFQSYVIAPTYSDHTRAPGLDKKVTQKYYLTDEKGEYVLDRDGKKREVSDSLLNLYEMFSQDIRLGNLDTEELEYLRLHLDLAHDLLQSGFPRAHIVVFERGVSVIESSHSKRGWLRKLMGTIRSESYHEVLEPQKSFWKGGKGGQQ